MIIPIRCFTCGKVVAGKWKEYYTKAQQIDNNDKLNQEDKTKEMLKLLDHLKLKRYCCRRMLLGHVDMVEKIV